MENVYKRLQGKEWHELKEQLKLIKYFINEKNHIKGFYKDKEGKKYTHWLNDKEIKYLIERSDKK